MVSISIIIPVYNEVDGISAIVEAFQTYLKKTRLDAKILFVNDGSTDGSLLEIEKVCLKESNCHFISFEKNAGLSAAIKAGFDYSNTDWVGYIDADLQTSPSDFLSYEPFLKEYDLITGKRMNRKDSFVKNMSSSFANWFRDSLLHDGVSDSGCPLKMIKRDLAVSLPFFKGMHRFIPALILMQGGKVKEIPVSHFPRKTGKSKFHLWNRLLSPFIDTLAVRWMMKRKISYKIEITDKKSLSSKVNE
jgi:glycosyltransferase involved in cell wall biosynthesis